MRQLIPFALQLAQRESLGERETHLLRYLNELHAIIDEQDLFMTRDVADRLPFVCYMCCNIYTDVSRVAFEKEENRWK